MGRREVVVRPEQGESVWCGEVGERKPGNWKPRAQFLCWAPGGGMEVPSGRWNAWSSPKLGDLWVEGPRGNWSRWWLKPRSSKGRGGGSGAQPRPRGRKDTEWFTPPACPAVPAVPGGAGVVCESCLLPRLQPVLAATTALQVPAGACSCAALCGEKLTQAALFLGASWFARLEEAMVNGAKVTDCSLHGWWADSLTCGWHSGPCFWCRMGRGGVTAGPRTLVAHAEWVTG